MKPPRNSTAPAPVALACSLCEAEALALFLAERAELWRRHASACGVAAPGDLAARLVAAHAAAVQQTARASERGPRAAWLRGR